MKDLLVCQDCNLVIREQDVAEHINKTGHMKGYKTLNVPIGGEGQAPTALRESGTANTSPPTPPSPAKGFYCPECGRPMTEGRFPDQVECEEHGAYTKEMAKELWEYQKGKPKSQYTPSGKEWASWRKTGRLSRGQKIGLTFMLAGSVLLLVLVYFLFFTHRWVF